MQTNIIKNICVNTNKRSDKFKLKGYRIFNTKCHDKICIHQEQTITMQELLEFSNYINKINEVNEVPKIKI